LLVRAAVVLFFCSLQAIGQSREGSFTNHTEVSPSIAGSKRFEIVSSIQSGITFTNHLTGLEYYKNMVAHNGAGVAVGDVNGDDLADVFLCNIQGANALYLNEGNFRFKDVSGPQEMKDVISTGATLVDVDGDGDKDLLVNGVQIGTRLFLNDGAGGFEESKNSGLESSGTTTSMALADIDGDGDLDLYVAHYIDWMHLADPTTRFEYSRRGDQLMVTRINGESTLKPRWKNRFTVSTTGRVRELPEADRLYINNGDGFFRDVSNEKRFSIDGMPRPLTSFREWGLAVTFRDVNNDFLPDLYVCNDFASPDRFWINKGSGQFELTSYKNIRHTSRSSMGVDFTDLNSDGVPDFMLLDMLDPNRARRLVQLEKEVERSNRLLDWMYVPRFNRNVLMVSQDGPLWFDTAYYSGVEASAWSWNIRFVDADLDGDDDMLVTNGFAFDTMDIDASLKLKSIQKTSRKDARSLYELKKLQPPYNSPNQLFRNDGQLRFVESGAVFGFAHNGITYGLGVADFDNDGDLDFITNNLNEQPSLYRNTSQEPRIQIRLKGGVGSKISLRHADGITVREVFSGGGYLSSDSGEVVFAMNISGEKVREASLEVEWSDGSKVAHLTNPKPNTIYRFKKNTLQKKYSVQENPLDKKMFLQKVDAIAFRHFPNLTKDYDENPFLLKRISATAPPARLRDFDSNGWLDLGFHLPRSGAVQVFLNQGGENFTPLASKYNDPNGLMENVGWLDGFTVLDNKPRFEQSLNKNVLTPEINQTLRLLLRADIDGNGFADAIYFTQDSMLDYPAASSAIVYLQNDGAFSRSETWEKSLSDLGRVSSAICVDIDRDFDADLLVANEAGSIKLFKNRDGSFLDVSESVNLDEHIGLWQGLAVGDFNNDGRMDFVAGNIGRNSPLEPYQENLVYLSRSQEPRMALFALNKKDKLLPIDDMDLFSRVVERSVLPQTYSEFSNSNLSIVLKSFGSMKQTEINCLETSVFLNREGKFERFALPLEAQLSPTSSISVADFDNDGVEDLFLSQNWFSIRPDLGRLDSSAGTILLGKGQGSFNPVSLERSGLAVLGESRNALIADFNHDGRSDIVATQTLGPTHLYLGQTENRGIRLIIDSKVALAKRLGCSVYLQFPDETSSPPRWLHSGDGVLAQCSTEAILGFTQWPSSILIVWSDGERQMISVQPGIYEYIAQ